MRMAMLSVLMCAFQQQSMAGEVIVTQGGNANIYVPNLACANDFTAGALFLRPGGSNDYAVLVNPLNPNVPTPLLSPFWEPKGIHPDFSPGFLLNYRHAFENSGNDVTFYWARLRTLDSSTFPVVRVPASAQQMAGPFWNIGPDSSTTSYADGQLKNSYDVLNAEVGKHVDFEHDLHIRFFTGISALWLQQKIAANFAGIDPIIGPYTLGTKTTSRYNAAGLRLGLDGEYEGWCNIKLVGLLAGDLYIGTEQPLTETVGTSSVLLNGGIPENHQSISHRRFVQLVPAIDTKLGVKYCLEYSDQKSFTVEAGYMASIYLNAIQNYVPSTYAPGTLGIVTGSVYLQSLTKSIDSFSLDGPYLNFTLNM